MYKCIENQRLLGVRSICNQTTVFKLYLEDIEGIDQTKVSKFASNETGLELMQKAVRIGWENTLEDALRLQRSEKHRATLWFNEIKVAYFQREFCPHIQSQFAGERGIVVKNRYPYKYQFSENLIDNIHIKTVNSQINILLKIRNNTNIYLVDSFGNVYLQIDVLNCKNLNNEEIVTIDSLDKIETTGGVTLTIPVNFAVTGDFEVVFDQTGIQTYQAFTPQSKACCGRSPEAIEVNGFLITDSFGVSLDLSLRCSEERIKCNMLVYLAWAARLRAVIFLLNEALTSDRMNFFTINSKEWLEEYSKSIINQYESKLNQIVPKLRTVLSNQDQNCFSCAGLTKRPISI